MNNAKPLPQATKLSNKTHIQKILQGRASLTSPIKANSNSEIDWYYVNKVDYDSSNHLGVLTQMHGSVWPRVFGYCIFNVFNCLMVVYIKRKYDIDLSFSDRGHTFMSMMVSFLMVTRSNIAYSRYMEARMQLAHAMTACRELISYATVFTRYDISEGANHWRVDLAKRTIKLLCAMVSVLEYESTRNDVWKIPALSVSEKNAIRTAVGKSNERTPMILCMFVRSTIAANIKYLQSPMHPNREMKLYNLVSDFVTAYHGLMKLVTTPFPFPLVQMTRTFLFIWIFTLPWVLVNDLKKVAALVFTVFFITYAFVGLELVAIELDDPFGEDENDFDLVGLVTITFKDIYIFIYDLQGEKESKVLFDFLKDINQKRKKILDESQKSAYDLRNGGTSHRSKRHKRFSSITAISHAVVSTEREEAGSETSRLLRDERDQEVDRVEKDSNQIWLDSLGVYHGKNVASYGSAGLYN